MNRIRCAGSVSVEVVLLTPVMVTLVMLVVTAGRGTQAQTVAQLAADHAARAASLVRPASAIATAHHAAHSVLETQRHDCGEVHVDVSAVWGRVAVEVTCRVDGRVVRASSSEVVDVYRSDR